MKEYCTVEERSEYNRLRRLAFPEVFRETARRKRLRDPEKIRMQKRESYLRHRSTHLARIKRYARENRERLKIYHREYRRKNRLRRNELERRRYHRDITKTRIYENSRKNLRRRTNLDVRILESLRQRLRGVLRPSKYKKRDRTLGLLGCSIWDLKMYLESKFKEGMTWENYGTEWHIDHIMPCAIFDLTKAEHQRRCFHFSNLQPLWVQENMRKSCKVLTNQFQLL